MLAQNAARIVEMLDDGAVVLDVGGGAVRFPRADWVMDLLPYEARGAKAEHERFSAQRWIRRDICDREAYPFEDGEIDFVVCSQTLEGIRDPLWVCSEMIRIAAPAMWRSRLACRSKAGEFRGPGRVGRIIAGSSRSTAALSSSPSRTLGHPVLEWRLRLPGANLHERKRDRRVPRRLRRARAQRSRQARSLRPAASGLGAWARRPECLTRN